MTTHPKTPPVATDLRIDRFLASVRAEGGERPHPASLALARQSRATGGKNRRLTEYLRIDRGVRA